ncbi:MAG: SPOR domain-containing protein [Psychromonas sp.]
MAPQFKNRLVGVTILVACVVIFLPTIIDGKKNSYVEEFTATPISPELKQHTSVNTNPDIDNPQSDNTNPDIDNLDSYLSAVSGDAASAQTSATDNNDDEWEIEEVANTVSISKQPEEIEDQEEVAKVEAVQKVQKVEAVQKTQKVAEIQKPQKVQQIAKVEKIPLPDNAWIIQIGAFQNAANIKALLKQLHTAGFQAHSVPAEIRDGVLTRVFVGPDVSQARLKEQLPRLKKLTNLDGKILPFKATNP